MTRSSRRWRSSLSVSALVAALATGLAVAPPAQAAPAAVGMATYVARLTGPGSINDTLGKAGVIGADLGITWDNGHGQTLSAFGDPASFDGWSLLRGQLFSYRSNVLMRSHDHNLADGMTFDSHAGPPGFAKRLLEPDLRKEVTIIPTAGISANGKQYMEFMSVGHWGLPGFWNTNWSGLAVSDDNGENWHAVNAFRPNSGGNHKFQQAAFMKQGDTVYMYGTHEGRDGAVYVSRVNEKDIEHLDKYEYFSAGHWVRGNPDPATPVMAPPNGEMSVAYNDYLGKYISLATTNRGVLLRTAPNPEGPWSAGQVIVTPDNPYTGYAPYIHPWSTGSTLYFTYSVYLGYQVQLMKVHLRR